MITTPSPALTLALSKGRILEETMPLLAQAGVKVDAADLASRKLIIPTSDPALRLLIVRASDVPTYVAYGAADMGVAGHDVLLEHGSQGLYQPVDLGIGRCRMCVAVQAGFDYVHAVRRGARLRVATKYTETARSHFAAKGVHVDLIKLYGSMELAPLVGLADAIVDLVRNQAALKTRGSRIAPYLKAFEKR
ncbi:MAG: ATP phosphoribosyltransferase [Betaproteobacteria bacterium]|nr:ATP phosphoribosyltransferase [Betaproteobacteria bacterium]